MSHGSTFGGNPQACAAALATLEVMRTDDLPGRAARLGEHLLGRLRAMKSPAIREVRGLGLMVGIEPDLLTVAKSMAGGLPMGACLIGPRIGAPTPMSHGSTFGGNPLACAAALATLEVMRTDDLPGRAARLGGHLLARLRTLQSPLIREVRGLGLIVGIDLRVKVTPILQKLQALGVLALPAGATVLRLLPPLVIEEGDLERVVDAIETALGT
jgi:acetylornithine/succinyldiaminopimelate/putrescine aminotransferase